MTPVFKLVRNGITPDVRRYATEFKKGLREVVRSTARGITRRVSDITPPASEGVSGRAAQQRGEAKIAGQMSAVMAPVRLKGVRKITTVFGHKLKRPVTVATKELYPDVAGLYRARLHASSSGFGFSTGRVRQKLYVDVRKFQVVLKERKANVGKLAAGWNAGASALDVPVQQWISRHGTSGGTVQIDTAGDRMRVTVENLAPGLPANVRAELARRIPYAVEYQANAMERAIQGYHERLSVRGARAA